MVVIGNAAAAGGPGGAGGGQSGGGGGPGRAGGPGGAVGCGGGDGGQGGSGGGIYNQGNLTLIDSTIRENAAGLGGTGGSGGSASSGTGGPGGAGGAGGRGGGIYNQGQLWVTASTIYENDGGPGGAGGEPGAAPGPGADGAGGPGAPGGGIFSISGGLTVENSTLVSNRSGAGGPGGGGAGSGGTGGSGGAIAVTTGASLVRNATLAENGAGAGGASGARPGASGRGGGLYVQSLTPADDMTLQNTIVASSLGSGCAATPRSAILNGGHDLSYGDRTCPGRTGNPRLGPLRDNGGRTATMALRAGSAAINRVPGRHGHCPATDQRGVHRPQGRRCDIGAYEFALPTITILSPTRRGSYERGSRLVVRFRCAEGGITSPITSCHGSIPRGKRIRTGRVSTGRLVVTATDQSGHRTRKTVHYSIWAYVDPLRAVAGLTPLRIDMGVDYSGTGPLLALGRGRVTVASNRDSGPSACWG